MLAICCFTRFPRNMTFRVVPLNALLFSCHLPSWRHIGLFAAIHSSWLRHVRGFQQASRHSGLMPKTQTPPTRQTSRHSEMLYLYFPPAPDCVLRVRRRYTRQRTRRCTVRQKPRQTSLMISCVSFLRLLPPVSFGVRLKNRRPQNRHRTKQQITHE